MNKYQRKINKLTKQYIINKKNLLTNKLKNIMVARSSGKTWLELQHIIKLTQEYMKLNSKSYYRNIRKKTRKLTKVNLDKDSITKYYQNKCYNIWHTNPLYEKAYNLWAKYYYETEKYDRLVCSIINEYGEAMPTNYSENALVQHNSKYWWEYIHKISIQEKIDKDTFKDARNTACRLNWKGLQDWNNRTNNTK